MVQLNSFSFVGIGDDAWEKVLSDATSNLNVLERERVAASASGALRRMLTGKMCKVLGMEEYEEDEMDISS